MKITGRAKVALGLVGAICLFFGLQYGVAHGIIPSPVGKSEVPKAAKLAAARDTATSSAGVVPMASLPSTTPATLNVPQMRLEHMAWNGGMGMMLANGGPNTTTGSLIATNGANLSITRQDDTNK